MAFQRAIKFFIFARRTPWTISPRMNAKVNTYFRGLKYLLAHVNLKGIPRPFRPRKFIHYQTQILLILVCAISLIFFYQSLNYYFFQDDWFVLNWVRTGDFASLFRFRTDIIYWRPLSMPVFFFLNYKLFGLNPSGYHFIIIIFHLVNSVLVYHLFRTLKFTQFVSSILSLMYATASFHFVSLSWLSTTSYVIGPTFIFATIILFLKNRNLFALFAFLLAVSSSELAFTVIPIALILKKISRATFKQLLPYIVIAFIYLVARFSISRPPVTGEYALSLDFQIFRTFFWYFVWFFNIPEAFSTILFFNQLKSSVVALLPFSRYIVLPAILVTIFILAFFYTRQNFRVFIKGVSLFIAGLMPVIFFPKHVYPMYLVITSLGILYIIGSILQRIRNKLLIFTFAILWIVSSFLTISFYRNSHWIKNEQAISKAYVDFMKVHFANPSSNSVFIFKSANIKFAQRYNFVLVETEDTLKQSLNDQDAIEVIYNDSTLRSFYVNNDNSASLLNNGAEIYEVHPREN